MTEHSETKCPNCGQKLRVPKNVGGLLMACPTCGEKFHSDFKIGSTGQRAAPRGLFITIFEFPYKMVSRMGRFFFPK